MLRLLIWNLTPYFTWKLTLDNGITMQIGHKDILTRLDHFVKVYPKIVGDRVDDVEYMIYVILMELRSNGRIRWLDQRFPCLAGNKQVEK